MTPLSIVTWKWAAPASYHAQFSAEAVNILFRMVRRHYREPFRAICVTDDAAGIDRGIEIVPIWTYFDDVPNPSGPNRPNCYRRLAMFSADVGRLFGPRFVSLDLDIVITGDLHPLWHRPEDFIIWKDPSLRTPYNASMILMTAGARRQVWEEFDPAISPARSLALGMRGSDQGWIGACLGPNEATWTAADGVCDFRDAKSALPAGARIVVMYGPRKPWDIEAQKWPWVREYYR